MQLRKEDLSKVWPPRPPSQPQTSKVMPIRKAKVVSTEKPKSRMVSVAKPAPPDAEVQQPDYTGYAGPRYDTDGR